MASIYIPESLLLDSVTQQIDIDKKRFFDTLATNVTSLPWASVNKAGSSLADLATRSAAALNSGTLALARLSGITNTEIAAAAAIGWTKIDKTGSSLADLATRSAGDLSSGTLSAARLPTLSMYALLWNTGAVGAGVTTFIGPRGEDTTEANSRVPIPIAGTIRNLYIVTDGAPGVGQTYTYTARITGADSAVTATLSGGAATTGNDTTHSAAVVAGDTVDIKLVTSGGAAVQRHAVALEVATA